MKDFHLHFCKDRVAELSGQDGGWYDNPSWDPFDLKAGDIDNVPSEAGTYVIGTDDGTMLIYPWGTSPIYYIGQSVNLQRRLLDHRKAIASANEEGGRWRARYHYADAFGAHCVWYLAGDVDPEKQEAHLLDSFFWRYGAIPVACGKDEWNKLDGES